MRKLKIAAIVLCAAVAVSDAYAMDLSLDTAVDMILDQSQDLKKATANVNQAEAQLDAVNANRWFKIDGTATYMNLVDMKNPLKSYQVSLPPELGGALSYYLDKQVNLPDKIDIPDSMFMAGVSVTQPIYTFGKIGNAVQAVKSAIKMAESSQELTRREIKYSAVDLYWTAKMTDEIVEISRSDLAAARDARRNLTSAGRANRSNLVKIESDIATKEINLSNAEFNRDTAHRMLKILAGIDVDTELNLTDEFPATFPDLNVGELQDTPQWDILNEQIQMYEHNARAQRANALPTLAATASYNYIAYGPNVPNMFGDDNMQSAYRGLA